jgi:glucokinase
VDHRSRHGTGREGLDTDGRKWVIVAGEGGHVTLPSASVQPRSVVLLVRPLEGPRSSLEKGGR